ncbi:rhomboid family intramembrane serine protease [Singulisphaera sp. PoT]|uniref:rhomboid family intramembrane serine protease n=1 Tax=Singulisphaera sp. PoT TaxID=3411797 RepID=UPI003BF4B606
MIVIPTGTDAPIYHWPYATVALILINIAVFVVVPPVSSIPQLDENDEVVAVVESNFDRYALAIGDGKLHPVQWFTHNFLHYGIGHLLGNMLFLWAFGIVVEGKLGAVAYLIMYAAIGTLHGLFVQLIMIRSGLDGHAAGASAIVYGLLATCMVWAPRNELNCTIILFVGFRILVFQWEPYFTTVALIYVGEQLLGLAFWGGVIGQARLSEMGHLSGALWGSVVAVLLLKARLVDCEGWDIFSVWSKNRKLGRDWEARGKRHALAKENEALPSKKKAKSKSKKKLSDDDAVISESRGASAVQRIQSIIADGDFIGALAAYDKARKTLPEWPPQRDLLALIKAFHARGAEVDSVRPMRDHCRRFPDASARIGLKLAFVLMRNCQRPTAALRILDEIPAGSLPAELAAAREKLRKEAAQMIEEGVLELEGDD